VGVLILTSEITKLFLGAKCERCGNHELNAVSFFADLHNGLCIKCDLEENGKHFAVHCAECGSVKQILALSKPDDDYTCDDCLKSQQEASEREEQTRLAETREMMRITEEHRRDVFLFEHVPNMFQNAYMETIPSEMTKNDVLLYGDFGTGKTYTAYAYARRLVMAWHIDSFVVTRAFKMMMEIKSGFSDKTYDKIFHKYLDLDLLVIDEWGKNTGSEFEESVLFEIINERYEARRQTVIIVNAKTKQDLISLIRPDVLDRFRRGIYEISGKSRR